LIADFLLKIIEIEENWNLLPEKQKFLEFIHHQKILMALQLTEWHGVRREILSMQSINNVTLEERTTTTSDGSIITIQEYRYLPPIEKSNFGPTRTLTVSEGKIF
jgi:hypothetical protein